MLPNARMYCLYWLLASLPRYVITIVYIIIFIACMYNYCACYIIVSSCCTGHCSDIKEYEKWCILYVIIPMTLIACKNGLNIKAIYKYSWFKWWGNWGEPERAAYVYIWYVRHPRALYPLYSQSRLHWRGRIKKKSAFTSQQFAMCTVNILVPCLAQ